ncbi:MAG: hypothetical protein JWR61_5639 [Ferruginibacter sp.]|uniref:hypothetical protein n=1 Tax=Ferruginibacter sp. TaxID=1940288 RepID=UPI00265B45A6|nr:hypothetical protein [Ferruginibacter sp.]MDB5280684.1 hypothetical protein [Ferruginibacter sp.]
MNIENISALMGQLQSLGFENAGYSLLKRISFKPENFILSQKIERAKDRLSFQLFFEKDIKQDIYVLSHYDAILQKETPLIDAAINGINTTNLEKSMIEIDWKNAFDFVTKKQLNLEDKTGWEKELKVESVIEGLSELEKSEAGKVVSVGLKLKYWAGISYQELFGNISPLKNKSEVSQRFYVFEGQTGISVDEAYRFLQIRWLEKQMQAKRKHTDSAEIGETEKDSHTSSGSGLLKKKRLGRSNTFKSKKQVQQ